MSPSNKCLSLETIIRIDEIIGRLHGLLVREILAGRATPVIEDAEQKLHDIRNEFAALTGLGFKFAVCDGELFMN